MSYTEFTDEDLFDRFTSGDKGAFNEICVRYNQLIYSYTFRHVKNIEDAKDLTQDIFKNLYQSAVVYDRRKGTVKSFVLGISRNKTLYYLRQQAKFSKTFVNERSRYDIENHSSVDGAKLIENQELMKNVMEFLSLLPPKERDVVNLRLEGVQLEEIAEILKVSYYAVKAASSRGFLSLRQKLRELGYVKR